MLQVALLIRKRKLNPTGSWGRCVFLMSEGSKSRDKFSEDFPHSSPWLIKYRVSSRRKVALLGALSDPLRACNSVPFVRFCVHSGAQLTPVFMLSLLFSYTSRVRRVTRLFSITSRVSVQPNFSCPLFSTTSWDSPRDFNIFLFCCPRLNPVFDQKGGIRAPIVPPICIRSVHQPIFDLIYFQSLPRFVRHAVALFCPLGPLLIPLQPYPHKPQGDGR